MLFRSGTERLSEFVGNRGGELPDNSDAVCVSQFGLHLTVLALATGDLQGNSGLLREVRDQFDLLFSERVYTEPRYANYSDDLLLFLF